MGKVVPARPSPTLPPHPLALCCNYPVSKRPSASIVVTSTLRVINIWPANHLILSPVNYPLCNFIPKWCGNPFCFFTCSSSLDTHSVLLTISHWYLVRALTRELPVCSKCCIEHHRISRILFALIILTSTWERVQELGGSNHNIERLCIVKLFNIMNTPDWVDTCVEYQWIILCWFSAVPGNNWKKTILHFWFTFDLDSSTT